MHWRLDTHQIGENKWVNQAFQNKKYAFAADYIRLFALYHYGGIYLDTDVELCKNAKIIEKLPYLIGSEGNGIIEAAVLGAEKNAEWVRCCLDYYNDKDFVKNDGSFDMRTLPSIMMEQLQKKYTFVEKDYINFNFENTGNQIFMLPKYFLSPKNMGTGIIEATDDTIAIHHFNMSWMEASGKKISDIKRTLMKWFGVRFMQNCIRFFKLKQIKDLFMR